MDSRELDQRKTLQTVTVAKSPDENDEFEKQRTAAIAEVAKTKEVCGKRRCQHTEFHFYFIESLKCWLLLSCQTVVGTKS